MSFLLGMNLVFIFQKAAFFIVTAVKISNLTQNEVGSHSGLLLHERHSIMSRVQNTVLDAYIHEHIYAASFFVITIVSLPKLLADNMSYS
jgi:hypothetical protein